MTDSFTITPLPQLLQIILKQLEQTGRFFGIPQELFFKSDKSDPYRSHRYGQLLETPIGIAAGPHTQLSQNIVAAWLTGARFIELKTVQKLDDLDVSKPCIDMQDEGYNCEWSQELKIHDSFNQYLDAWILIHVLQNKLGLSTSSEPGVIFNMSVGYDYTGILSEKIQWFLRKMGNASKEIESKIESISDIYPDAVSLNINPCISDNITLSTMHGCPPEEIEKIGKYLLEEKELHTAIKLNPTLLGKKELLSIVNNSGFETRIPDIAFEHDLKYDDAVGIIHNLQNITEAKGLHFSLKLTNTLESENHKKVFPPKEKMMYLSGRVLHPISIRLANKLQQTFDGRLDISFCGGVDTFNVSETIACGLYPVTVCSDILKPGGYGRLHQYISRLGKLMEDSQTNTLSDLVSKSRSVNAATNLEAYAIAVLDDKRFKKVDFHDPNIKTNRPLKAFDCIQAPCIDNCPTHQDIPDYLHATASGEFDKAFGVIMKTNPFPRVTGMVCDHLCQTKCTRINYDSSLRIRDVKRFVAERGNGKGQQLSSSAAMKTAIIGAGPSGLSCAYFLRRAGFEVKIYESKAQAGGMVSGAIPSFRLTDEALESDIQRIKKLGVGIHYDINIHKAFFEKLRMENDYLYIATGAQQSVKLQIEGIDTKGVLDPLHFLHDTKAGKSTAIGRHVVILGGGNTAMDAARTAYRLVENEGTVTIIYRRTRKEMPADIGEIKAVLEEGMQIVELTSPLRINTKESKLVSLTCYKMRLGENDESGRPRPVRIPDSEFVVNCDTIIPAVGQQLQIDFAPIDLLSTKPDSYETQIPDVFIGGDAMRGASTAINAIGDGRKAAEEIILRSAAAVSQIPQKNERRLSLNTHMANRSKRTYPIESKELPLNQRKNFNLVNTAMTENEAMEEASRCLLCDEVCNICTTVCPNLALHFYEINTPGYENLLPGIKQDIQILHIADWCNECGNCTTFCPTAGSPYKDKPHLYIDRKSFEKEKDGYYFEKKNNKQQLHHRQDNHYSILTRKDKIIIYESGDLRIEFDSHLNRLSGSGDDPLSHEAVEMNIIMQGAMSFFG